MKRCSHCKKEKEDADFYLSKAQKDGLQNSCISCLKSYCAQKYQEDPEKYRKRSKLYNHRRPESIARKVKAKAVEQEAEELYAEVKERKSAKYLYFIQCGQFIKIGVAKNVEKRLRVLSTGSPEPLNLVVGFSNMGCIEKDLHRKFSHLKSNGEWFYYTDEIKKEIDNLRTTLRPESG